MKKPDRDRYTTKLNGRGLVRCCVWVPGHAVEEIQRRAHQLRVEHAATRERLKAADRKRHRVLAEKREREQQAAELAGLIVAAADDLAIATGLVDRLKFGEHDFSADEEGLLLQLLQAYVTAQQAAPKPRTTPTDCRRLRDAALRALSDALRRDLPAQRARARELHNLGWRHWSVTPPWLPSFPPRTDRH